MNIRNHFALCLLILSALTATAQEKGLRPDPLQKVDQMISELDIDDDGLVSKAELEASEGSKLIQNFENFDLDKDGNLNKEEFVNLFRANRTQRTQGKADRARKMKSSGKGLTSSLSKEDQGALEFVRQESLGQNNMAGMRDKSQMRRVKKQNDLAKLASRGKPFQMDKVIVVGQKKPKGTMGDGKLKLRMDRNKVRAERFLLSDPVKIDKQLQTESRAAKK